MTRAYVNHGRWVADCPMPDCPGAEQVVPGDLLVCGNCGTSTRVNWPLCMGQIDRALMARPVPQTRNWVPGETVTDLRRENLEHGV